MISRDGTAGTQVAAQSLSGAQLQTTKEPMAPKVLPTPYPCLCRLRNEETGQGTLDRQISKAEQIPSG